VAASLPDWRDRLCGQARRNSEPVLARIGFHGKSRLAIHAADLPLLARLPPLRIRVSLDRSFEMLFQLRSDADGATIFRPPGTVVSLNFMRRSNFSNQGWLSVRLA
jgi:hypothetical protein